MYRTDASFTHIRALKIRRKMKEIGGHLWLKWDTRQKVKSLTMQAGERYNEEEKARFRKNRADCRVCINVEYEKVRRLMKRGE